MSFWAISIISSYLHFIPKVQTQLKILVFQGSLKKITAATPAFSSKTTHVSNFGGHLLLAQKYRQKIKKKKTGIFETASLEAHVHQVLGVVRG